MNSFYAYGCFQQLILSNVVSMPDMLQLQFFYSMVAELSGVTCVVVTACRQAVILPCHVQMIVEIPHFISGFLIICPFDLSSICSPHKSNKNHERYSLMTYCIHISLRFIKIQAQMSWVLSKICQNNRKCNDCAHITCSSVEWHVRFRWSSRIFWLTHILRRVHLAIGQIFHNTILEVFHWVHGLSNQNSSISLLLPVEFGVVLVSPLVFFLLFFLFMFAFLLFLFDLFLCTQLLFCFWISRRVLAFLCRLTRRWRLRAACGLLSCSEL